MRRNLLIGKVILRLLSSWPLRPNASSLTRRTSGRPSSPLQNVSVPFLGSFLVCKALDTATGQKMSLVRPFFELLAGRFAAVPKHIGKHAPSTGGAACQPSYVAIAKAASVHRVLAAQVTRAACRGCRHDPWAA